jgi:hypothetical protein
VWAGAGRSGHMVCVLQSLGEVGRLLLGVKSRKHLLQDERNLQPVYTDGCLLLRFCVFRFSQLQFRNIQTRLGMVVHTYNPSIY